MSETFEALHFLADLKDKNVCRYLKFSFKFFKSVEKSSSTCRISSAMKKVFFFCSWKWWGHTCWTWLARRKFKWGICLSQLISLLKQKLSVSRYEFGLSSSYQANKSGQIKEAHKKNPTTLKVLCNFMFVSSIYSS